MQKMYKKISVFLIALAISFSGYASAVDTVLTYSPSMKKNIKAVVITPDTYKKKENFPVLYMLHGYSGNYGQIINYAPDLRKYADDYGIVIVCPDGNYGSWYFDSPIDSSWRYETYVAKELVQWIDSHYKTNKSRTARAITGLSMGGHGALYLSFRHQDVFGAAGSMSGGVDFTPFPLNWDIAKRLGSYSEHEDVWQKNTVINLTHLLINNSLTLIIDCGTEDFFYKVNLKLHEKLLYENISHDFITRAGGHNGEYWQKAIQYQVFFFHNYFEQSSNH